MLGGGCGPLLCAFAHFALGGVVQPFLETSVVMLPIQLFILIAVRVCMEMPTADTSAIMPHQISNVLQQGANGHRVAFICVALAFVGVRGFIVSGVEAGTSMILETEFGWSVVNVGLAIGITYLMCIPLKAVHAYVGRRGLLTEWEMFRALMALTFLGAFCFQEFLCKYAPCPFIILVGDALVFPCFYFASGLIDGILMRQVSNEGFFRQETVILMKVLMVDGIGRTFGPPLARSTMFDHGHYYGRDLYASMQAFCIFAAYLVMESTWFASRSHLYQTVTAVDKKPNEKQFNEEYAANASDGGRTTFKEYGSFKPRPGANDSDEHTRKIPEQKL
jgi:hypothetical protein